MPKQSIGKLKRTGSIVMETYAVRLTPKEQKEFSRDPYTFARRYLRQQGFKVREVILGQRQGPRQRMEAIWSIAGHVIFPAGQVSGWV